MKLKKYEEVIREYIVCVKGEFCFTSPSGGTECHSQICPLYHRVIYADLLRRMVLTAYTPTPERMGRHNYELTIEIMEQRNEDETESGCSDELD